MGWYIAIAIVLLGIIASIIHDKTQTKYPVLRRYPVLGWGRTLIPRPVMPNLTTLQACPFQSALSMGVFSSEWL